MEGETDTSDNTLEDGRIIVAMPDDVTGLNSVPDGKVDVRGVYKVAQNYGTVLPPDIPPWNQIWGPICDINNNDKVDVKDYYIVCKHYGEVDP